MKAGSELSVSPARADARLASSAPWTRDRSPPTLGFLRNVSSSVHLWAGLAISGIIVLLSLTGSILVFGDAIDSEIRPDLHRVSPGDTVSVDAAVEAVRQTRPEATPWIVGLPSRPDRSLTVSLGPESDQVYVDPYTGTVLGSRGPEEGWMNILFALHAELLAGTTGAVIVGLTGLLLVLVSVTGLVLWWPRRRRALPSALTVALRSSWKRFNYDLHRAGGLYTLAFVSLTGLTGAALIFYLTTQEILDTATGSPAWPPAPPELRASADSLVGGASAGDGPAARLDRALATARSALSEATASYVYLPQSQTDPVTVRMRTPPEWHPNGRSYVHTTRSGELLRVDDARSAPIGSKLLQAVYPLHIGTIGPPEWHFTIRVLYALLGLSPVVLSVTGSLIWFRRWRRTGAAAPDESSRVAVRQAVGPDP